MNCPGRLQVHKSPNFRRGANFERQLLVAGFVRRNGLYFIAVAPCRGAFHVGMPAGLDFAACRDQRFAARSFGLRLGQEISNQNNWQTMATMGVGTINDISSKTLLMPRRPKSGSSTDRFPLNGLEQ